MIASPVKEAERLIELFRTNIGQSDLHIPEYFKETMHYEEEEKQLAIQCAITHVNLLLTDHIDLVVEKAFYMEVKKILESQVPYENA
jgi:hypothetical protein